MPSENTITVAVGTIGRAHGLKGEVAVMLRTDIPEVRLADGAVLDVNPAGVIGADTTALPRTLTVTSTRIQQGRWYAKFAELRDRTAAEQVRGADLTVRLDRDEEFEQDPDAWYPSELKGLPVVTADGTELGTVLDLEHYPAQDVLIVRAVSGQRVMLPFVEELVPEVDLEQGRIVADPPGGLFDPENADSERD
ncbi:ribosome maturation factor RimM [Helcobacillus sp. ACRRO]|uniref:ribosome maturation factor RimM n=1 Tax=Helcobacillus TaxID=1161125 RepID=UPI001EF4A55B|nr:MULTISPECIES: ribosome maturation factor RimM [Helcobacillus]MCG7427771.1 ribosome maturation factor RimM [Helcobacillus sp. ACRRO]MDK7742741.1 ribosome maturation factor RimM [Helcobacillus massiliensis]WOO93282.1 ribosome maturation factor RimM [Helcobacillus massiliensis]